MSTKNSRDKHGKHKKNPQAVRNQRVIVFTFVIILALMYQSSHWKLEKERLTETIAQLESLEKEAMAPVEENRGEDGDGPAEEETSEGVSDLPEEENVPEGDDSLMEESMEESAEEGEKTSDGDSSAGDEAGETSDGLVIREEDMWCLILTNARYPVPDDYEVELAVVLGRDALHVREEDVGDYIFGYSVANDVSARDVQYRHKQNFLGKSLDTFFAMGPVIVTADEFPCPPALSIRSFVNGELRQNSVTDQVFFNIRHIVSELSQGMTLPAGTILITGTPAGVGMGMDPPCFLKRGDVVTCEIDGIGRISNPIR